MNRSSCLFSILFITISSVSLYCQKSQNKLIENIDIKPIIVNTQVNGNNDAGLKYQINGTLIDENLVKTDSGNYDINTDVTVAKFNIQYQSGGTILINDKKNPLNFMESTISGKFFYSSSILSMLGGIFYKYENDQQFVNKNTVLGLNVAIAKYGFGGENNYIAIYNNIGLVNPVNDSLRKKIVIGEIKKYYRWDFELLISINLSLADLSTFEFNYRIFNELNAPNEIKVAGLDQYMLSTFRLGFKNNLYVAYSYGRMPFDKKDDNIYEIGFSYKLTN
jgi:hypothetical protein